MNNFGPVPTGATQAKERLYTQLAASLGRMSRALSQTSDLCERLQVDLHAMRVFAGLDAAKCVIICFGDLGDSLTLACAQIYDRWRAARTG